MPQKTKAIRKSYTVFAREQRIELGKTTKIMGIINVTPDSFSSDGCLQKGVQDISSAVKLAKKFIRSGVDILDIGGESSRPGAKRVSAKEEAARVIPVIKALKEICDLPISIDTYKSSVAERALKAGASIVNNIEGCNLDPKMVKIVNQYDAAIILMHMQGTPQTMQKKIHYSDIVGDIQNALKKSIENCLENGIKSNRIIIDPGIGFGKTVEHNLCIINRLEAFQSLNQPILIGTSRKSFIGKILNTTVSNRLMGTTASVCASIIKGAHIVRVHDVKQIQEAVAVTDAIVNEKQ